MVVRRAATSRFLKFDSPAEFLADAQAPFRPECLCLRCEILEIENLIETQITEWRTRRLFFPVCLMRKTRSLRLPPGFLPRSLVSGGSTLDYLQTRGNVPGAV